MAYIVQVDFLHDGVFRESFSDTLQDLANDIVKEDGFLWKIWTQNKDEKSAGGIYYFEDLKNTQRYLKKHIKRLESFGYTDIRAKIFEVNLPLSKICKANFL